MGKPAGALGVEVDDAQVAGAQPKERIADARPRTARTDHDDHPVGASGRPSAKPIANPVVSVL